MYLGMHLPWFKCGGSKDNTQESVLSFYPDGHKVRKQAIIHRTIWFTPSFHHLSGTYIYTYLSGLPY